MFWQIAEASLGMVNFSVVVPVHNEAEMLTYSLPSLCKLGSKEVIFVLDRCTDSTEKVIKEFWKRHDSVKPKLVLLRFEERSRWRMHLNFLYDLGIRKARSEVALLSQADHLLDYVRIKDNVNYALGGMVSFAVLEHPHICPWNHFVTNTLHVIGGLFDLPSFGEIIGIEKQLYLSRPLTSDDLFSFDTQLRIVVEEKKYAYRFVRTKSLSLRPWVRSKLWSLGVDKYKAKKRLWKVLLFSLLRLMPEVFAGYLHAKAKY